MNSLKLLLPVSFLACLCLPTSASWFDSEDMKLFDLVEEVNGTFYEFMQLNQSATSSDVKKAFRTLSLKLHPDKNASPDADLKFRQLVSISDILRDDEKRAKYDNILVNGLPDWKTGMYYIRRARKLGLLEGTIILSLILTIGHYLFLIASYYEDVYNISEATKKRDKKSSKKSSEKTSEEQQFLEETLESLGVRKPAFFLDNLPVKTALFSYRLIVYHIPAVISFFITSLMSRSEGERTVTEEESDSENEVRTRVKFLRVKNELPDLTGQEDQDLYPVVYAGQGQEFQDKQPQPEASSSSQFKSKEWSSEEVHHLIKLSKKFPPGVNQRWERISESLGRSLEDVIQMSKNLKSREVKVREPSLVLATTKSSVFQSVNNDISVKDPGDTSTLHSISSSSLSIENWSQEDQKLLEEALQKFPRGVQCRWERIADLIPGKTKEDCILRFKWLSDLVKRKKTASSKVSTGEQ